LSPAVFSGALAITKLMELCPITTSNDFISHTSYVTRGLYCWEFVSENAFAFPLPNNDLFTISAFNASQWSMWM
jgi:hypothetical protein